MAGRSNFLGISSIHIKGLPDEIFLNQSRTLVLEIMLENTTIHLAKIMKKSHLTFSEVMGHLLAFERLGLVTEKVIKGERIFTLVSESALVRKRVKLKQCWDDS